MIDYTKPLYAKVFDFDKTWEEENQGYIVRRVMEIHLAGVYEKEPYIWLENGLISRNFELLEQEVKIEE